jgi:hypothetical protein
MHERRYSPLGLLAMGDINEIIAQRCELRFVKVTVVLGKIEPAVSQVWLSIARMHRGSLFLRTAVDV